ncbi:MAG: hypothetical protein IT210_14880 [Armatimonadetes bacterium]|nr:hypothetical protein [Armatimonadota bacterium]
MTAKERYLETLLFGKPDKVPFSPGGPRESTLRAWREQGLPEGKNYFEAVCETVGMPVPEGGMEWIPVSFQMIPQFEEKVLEHRDGHYVVQDWMGAITEISDEFDYTYIRAARDFVTRKWHRFPVQTREDWERMKERFRLDTPGRFAEDFAGRCAEIRKRGLLTTTHVNGPFWQLREWCGFEGLCTLFIDDPEFVREMVVFWQEFVAQILERITAQLTLGRLGISEDMAYKAHSMISPAMTRKYLLPCYERWVGIVKKGGGQLIDMDSDGYIGELIPIWIDAGINVCCPIEVAAHNDIVEFRERFGKKMAYTGGIDKRAMAKGGVVMEAEVMRVVPSLFQDGGFIPGCDHGVPPDISWPDFIEYSRLLAKLCGWVK